jgi:hypothetical protein
VHHNGERTQLITLYTRVLLELACDPQISQETLARRLDVTMRTAQRHLTELELDGYLTVDRRHRPFLYGINWSKKWPHVGWLRVIVFHPEVANALRRLSDTATRRYEEATIVGVDPTPTLRNIFAAQATAEEARESSPT